MGVGFWPCHAPFNQCPGITGDLPQCQVVGAALGAPQMPLLEGENKHIRGIKQAYNRFDVEATPLESMKFHVALFEREVRFRLGEDLGKAAKGLRLAKEPSLPMDFQLQECEKAPKQSKLMDYSLKLS